MVNHSTSPAEIFEWWIYCISTVPRNPKRQSSHKDLQIMGLKFQIIHTTSYRSSEMNECKNLQPHRTPLLLSLKTELRKRIHIATAKVVTFALRAVTGNAAATVPYPRKLPWSSAKCQHLVFTWHTFSSQQVSPVNVIRPESIMVSLLFNDIFMRTKAFVFHMWWPICRYCSEVFLSAHIIPRKYIQIEICIWIYYWKNLHIALDIARYVCLHNFEFSSWRADLLPSILINCCHFEFLVIMKN